MTQEAALAVLKKGGNVFLTGEPGAGKTHTINRFKEWMDMTGRRYAVTASTGIAATHINGQTIHSWSGIKIKSNLNARQIEAILQDEYTYARLMKTETLIIDEVSMLDAQFIQDLDSVLRAARNTTGDGVFGGIQIVFVGDFFQLPPVVKDREMKFAFEAKSWEEANLSICYLHEQHRQSDAAFLDLLSAMRNGAITEKHKDLLRTRLPKNLEKMPNIKTRLFTHNVDVDNLNDIELQRITGKERVYEMRESGVPYLVSKLKENCLSPEKLRIRIGATVMFTRNNFDEGYVNGTLGTVTDYSSDGWPVVTSKAGNVFIAKPAEWSFEEYGVTKAEISQVPLKLAWAITVHKSQGMSLDEAIIDLSKAFVEGQGYVAISRVRSLEGMVLEGVGKRTFDMHPKVVEYDKRLRELSGSIKTEVV
jgi:ATP-dependent DNA helicase PIF1